MNLLIVVLVALQSISIFLIFLYRKKLKRSEDDVLSWIEKWKTVSDLLTKESKSLAQANLKLDKANTDLEEAREEIKRFSEEKNEEEAQIESFVRSHLIKRATPETYRNVFDLDVNGQRVLDHLQLVFANKSTYVQGGQEAERESCFRAGQAHVIGFIFNQINKANDQNYKGEVDES